MSWTWANVEESEIKTPARCFSWTLLLKTPSENESKSGVLKNGFSSGSSIRSDGERKGICFFAEAKLIWKPADYATEFSQSGSTPKFKRL